MSLLQHPKPRSFLDLPLELRQEIYRHLFGKWRRLRFSCQGSRWGIPFPYNHFGSTGGLHASHPLRQELGAFIGILTVSKQISYESLHSLYSTSTFHVGIGPHFTRWPATSIVPHIRHLEFCIPCWSVVPPCPDALASPTFFLVLRCLRRLRLEVHQPLSQFCSPSHVAMYMDWLRPIFETINRYGSVDMDFELTCFNGPETAELAALCFNRVICRVRLVG